MKKKWVTLNFESPWIMNYSRNDGIIKVFFSYYCLFSISSSFFLFFFSVSFFFSSSSSSSRKHRSDWLEPDDTDGWVTKTPDAPLPWYPRHYHCRRRHHRCHHHPVHVADLSPPYRLSGDIPSSRKEPAWKSYGQSLKAGKNQKKPKYWKVFRE